MRSFFFFKKKKKIQISLSAYSSVILQVQVVIIASFRSKLD